MKVGVETAMWGLQIDDLARALDAISEAGFHGVEFTQHFDSLGIRDIDQLLEMLYERRLELIGIRGGTLDERIRFCRRPCPEYLYVEPWELHAAPRALAHGFVPAVHPRPFTTIRKIADLSIALAMHPGLRVLLDTANLAIAGDAFGEALDAVGPRLAAVYLADWRPDHGRASYRCGKGLTELGSGIVGLDAVLRLLNRHRYDSWLVTGVQQSAADPDGSVRACARWLGDRGLIRAVPSAGMRSVPDAPASSPPLRQAADATFLTMLASATTDTPRDFYQAVAHAFARQFDCELVRVWEWSPPQDHLHLLGQSPASVRAPVPPLKAPAALASIAAQRHAPATRFDLGEPRPGARYGYSDVDVREDVPDAVGATTMVTIPVYAVGGHNHVRLLISLYSTVAISNLSDEDFSLLSRTVTTAADLMLDRLSYAALARVNAMADHTPPPNDFVAQLNRLIGETISCEASTVFLVSESYSVLEAAASTGLSWRTKERFYRPGEGLVGQSWRRGEALLTTNAATHPSAALKSAEVVSSPEQHTVLLAPIIARGRVLGVVRCRNKLSATPGGDVSVFTNDDAALLDAVCSAAAMHIEILKTEQRRTRSCARLTHELRAPITVIRGAAERIGHELDGGSPADIRNLLKDIDVWSRQMGRLVENIDALGHLQDSVVLHAGARVFLLRDIIFPVLIEIDISLRERGFSRAGISWRGFKQLPPLWVDKQQLQQAVFNILSDSVKYALSDRKAFQIEVVAEPRDEWYVLRFRDWGIGIEEDLVNHVFIDGFRTPRAVRHGATDPGVGLRIARRVIEAHGGICEVTHPRMPTEISVSLPRTLAGHPPERLRQNT